MIGINFLAIYAHIFLRFGDAFIEIRRFRNGQNKKYPSSSCSQLCGQKCVTSKIAFRLK